MLEDDDMLEDEVTHEWLGILIALFPTELLGNWEAWRSQDEQEKAEENEQVTEAFQVKISNLEIVRLSVAELKQLVARPDVVEMHDVTARDPRSRVCRK